MNEKLQSLCEELTKEIQSSYEESVTIEQAEKLAAKFLHAQLLISDSLSKKDLDSRMKKSGVKAIKAAVYHSEATRGDKKPSDTFLQSLVDMSEEVAAAQDSFDKAEVEKDALQNYFNIFKEAHIFYRGISKGRFE